MRALSYVNFCKDRITECENLVLMCMDFRFRKPAMELLSYSGYKDCDLVAMPGGSLAATNEEARDILFRAIDTAISAHKIKRVIIVDHIDCRAYGGSEAFDSAEEEEEFHSEALAEAARIIQDKYDNLEVITTFLDWLKLKPVAAEAETIQQAM